MTQIEQFVEIYRREPNPAVRQRIRQKADWFANSPASDAVKRRVNAELLVALNEAEKQLVPAQPAQVVKIELPDISGQTVLKLSKYAAIAGGGYVALYAIGAAAVGIGAAITAFFAAYGIYLVGVAVCVAVLRSIGWRRRDKEETQSETTSQQNIVINVTASNGGGVNINKE